MKITHYQIKDIEDIEQMLNSLFIALSTKEKLDKSFKFKIEHTDKVIEVKILEMNESVN
jgi:hypothetical protein